MGFRDYAVKRTINAFAVVIIVVVLNFFLFRVLPGNPITYLINPNLPIESRQAILKLWGLDKPLYEQFLTYVVNMLTGNLGVSFSSTEPVAAELMDRLPNTILLLGSATIIQIMLGIALGVVAVSRRGTRTDLSAVGLGLFSQSVPVFFIGLLLLLIFGYYLPITTNGLINFPLAGTISRPPPRDQLGYVLDVLWHLALPLVTLVVINFGGYILIIRNLMIDALSQDYITTAKAKGLDERSILYKHGLGSILPPVITIVGLSLASVVGGAVITETIFTWHGVGRYLYEAVLSYDYPVMQGTFFFLAVVTIVANYIVDLIYGLLDPRIKY
jgi:peptide/nickel transport system permease protein